MNFYLITNVQTNSGKCDYKGLDTDLFIAGTQRYPNDLRKDNFCVIATKEDFKDVDYVKKINQQQYDDMRAKIALTYDVIEETEQERLLKEKQELENQLLIEKDKNIGGIL